MANSSMIKDRKYMPPIQEIAIVDNQATYPINSSSIEGLEFLSRKPNEKFYIMVKDADYTLEQVSGVWNITIINTDLLEAITDIQVASALTIESGEYDPIGSVDIVTLKDYYNKLYRDFINLQSFYNINSFLTDGLTDNLVLPSLKPNETWVMNADGEVVTTPIEIINDSVEKLLEDFKKELDDFTEEQKVEINDVADARIVDINANADARKFEIETLAENERISIDQFTEVQKDEITTTTNVGKFQLNQIIEDGKSQLLERVSTSTSYNSVANEYSVTTTNPRVHYQGEIMTITFSDTNVLVNPNIRFDQDISFYPLRLLQNNQAVDLPPNYINTTKIYEVSYVGNNFLLSEAGYSVATDDDLGVVKGGFHNTIGVDGSINVNVANGTLKGVVSQGTGCTIVDGVLNVIPPIGMTVFMANGTNPATIWSGTGWLPIEDYMIRAAKSTENALATGGSDSATLTEANMYPHTHIFTGNSASVTRGTMEITGGLISNGTVYTGSSSSGAFSISSIAGGFQHGNAGESSKLYASFFASHNWTGSSSSITPTGTNSTVGSASSFSIVNKYTALKVWYRVS